MPIPSLNCKRFTLHKGTAAHLSPSCIPMQCPFLVQYYNIPLLLMLIPFQSLLDIISSPKLKGQSHHNVHSSVHWTIKHKNRYNNFPRISPIFKFPLYILCSWFLCIIIIHMWSCLVCIRISITNVTDTFLVWTNDAQKHPKLASKYKFSTSAVYKTLLCRLLFSARSLSLIYPHFIPLWSSVIDSCSREFNSWLVRDIQFVLFLPTSACS